MKNFNSVLTIRLLDFFFLQKHMLFSGHDIRILFIYICEIYYLYIDEFNKFIYQK